MTLKFVGKCHVNCFEFRATSCHRRTKREAVLFQCRFTATIHLKFFMRQFLCSPPNSRARRTHSPLCELAKQHVINHHTPCSQNARRTGFFFFSLITNSFRCKHRRVSRAKLKFKKYVNTLNSKRLCTSQYTVARRDVTNKNFIFFFTR